MAVIYFGMPAHIVSGLVACHYGIVFKWPPGSVCVCVCVCAGWTEAMLLIGSEYMLKCLLVCFTRSCVCACMYMSTYGACM